MHVSNTHQHTGNSNALHKHSYSVLGACPSLFIFQSLLPSGRYNEVVEYTWTQPGFSPATGHFTQVVWRGSSMLGCAAQVCLNNITGTNFPRGTLVICR